MKSQYCRFADVYSCSDLNSLVSLQMSFAEDLPDMDGTDLLSLLFQGEENGPVEPLFPVEDELMESWLSEQDVRFMSLRFCRLDVLCL